MRPVSLICIPKQTSAPHILLYSEAFFIKLALQRSHFWRIDFLLGLELSFSFGCIVPILVSSMVPRVHSKFCNGGPAIPTMRKEMKAALYRHLGPRSSEATLSEDVMTSPPSLKRMADGSVLAGIMQEHTEATVYAGHGFPRPLQ
jgi:hypothetical protein